MTELKEIILKDLPKISLNQWYAGKHWSKRKQIKDTYKLLVKNQFKHVFSKDYIYRVEYYFNFKLRPLDASNCVSMIKMVEDIIFEDDKYNIVEGLYVQSRKSDEDFLKIIVKKFGRV